MRLVSFGDDRRVGYVDGEEIAVLDVPTMRKYFERGGADETGERVRLRDAPPGLIALKKLVHTAGNFREHEEESKQVGWSHEIAPWIVFFQNVDAIVGPDEPVVYPEHLTEELDYELELWWCCGSRGSGSPEQVLDYVGGYVIFNDITARDIQRREMRSAFSFCKAIDTFCPLGPWIVTPDEVPEPHDLAMELRVNGEPRQVSHSGRMSVTIPEILSHYSALGYWPGTSSPPTVSGVAGFSPDAASLYLRPGDVMEAEIERIGVLRNPVVSWQEAHGEPASARVGSVARMSDEFRVEVELDDAEHGYSLGERLRAPDLDDDARRRLGSGVMVTRDGSRLFAYAATEAEAREVERTIGGLVEADGPTAELAVTRWHEVEEAWKDASIPLPATPAEEHAELSALEASEAREAEVEGRYDWEVVVRPRRARRRPGARTATRARGGFPVSGGGATSSRARRARRWRRSRGASPRRVPDADVEVDVDLSDVARSPLQFLPF